MCPSYDIGHITTYFFKRMNYQEFDSISENWRIQCLPWYLQNTTTRAKTSRDTHATLLSSFNT